MTKNQVMRKYNIAIAEDHEDSRHIIESFICYLPNMEVVFRGKDGKELLDFLMNQKIKVDIALVDIRMPRLNGIETMKVCKQFAPDLKCIFITGYEEYAVEAFSVSAVDYVVKPIQQQRLYEALQKAVYLIDLESEPIITPLSPVNSGKVIIKKGRSTFYLSIDMIYFIEKDGKKTKVHTKNGVYDTFESLDSIEKEMKHSSFFRTHRSYLVNLSNVLRIEASGKTYLAYFVNYSKAAHISKLKISEVQKLIQ
ncbi:LytR/AlgR family response regulator transcription factor [Halalkalibacter alkalisediminis]|uniref:LytR/AlgR family response regulator transcription factor n=1 Tax=Halalkalibacter alkalisediminis TaxID=935616 RepID=A0ABV6NIR3_9BACI|nr:LytTR family DNA-binding domain-containing protein [Halalkalibacter alkalisediminis]